MEEDLWLFKLLLFFSLYCTDEITKMSFFSKTIPFWPILRPTEVTIQRNGQKGRLISLLAEMGIPVISKKWPEKSPAVEKGKGGVDP